MAKNSTEIDSNIEHYKKLRLSIISIIFITLTGTIGYRLIEGWSFLESFYMTVITVATVGFGEVNELSDSGIIFTILLIIFGVSFFLFSFSTLAEVIIQGSYRDILGRKKMKKIIQNLSDHYIIAGYGRMGQVIANEFKKGSVPYICIENNPEIILDLEEQNILFIQGDAGLEETLESARITKAKGLVCVCSSDAANLMITLTARDLNPKIFIVARAEQQRSEKKLKQVGADKIISPIFLGGLRMAQSIMFPAVMNFIEVTTLNQEYGLTIEELAITKNSLLCGMVLKDSTIKEKFDIMVLAVQGKEDKLMFNPDPNKELNEGEKLILMGHNKNLMKLALWAGI